jgi:hypothetical protein
MYQIYDKVREMSLYFRYFLTWEVLQRQVSVIYYEFFGLFFWVCRTLSHVKRPSSSEDNVFLVLPCLRASAVQTWYKKHVGEAGHAEQSSSRIPLFFLLQRRNGKNSDETNTLGIIIIIVIVMSPIAAENREQ